MKSALWCVKGLQKLFRISDNTPRDITEVRTMTENYIDTREAAQLSGYTEQYMRKLVRLGRIQGKKIRRDWLLDRDSLKKFLATDRKVGRPSVDKSIK
jgi:excisionase family DNA binding protein